MADRTKVEWAEASWNPVTGCTPISEACQHCYAARMAKRLAGRCGYPVDEPFRVTLHEDKLGEPLKWKKPRRIFVVSMGDLFHDDVPKWYLYKVFMTMEQASQHTFILLTKRAERMRDFILDWVHQPELPPSNGRLAPNIWTGVTAENQQRADERIPILLQVPAARRWVSVEPMLGPVDLVRAMPLEDGALDEVDAAWDVAGEHPPEEFIEECELEGDWVNHGNDLVPNPEYAEYFRDRKEAAQFRTFKRGLSWVVCGGETGPGARPMHPDWVRGLRDQCKAAGVPLFFKAWGDWEPGEEHPYPFGPAEVGECCIEHGGSYRRMYRVGKARAGHLLDGIEYREYPH